MNLAIIITVNTIIFLALSSLHLYWVVGGQWGLQAAIPDQWKQKALNMKNSHFVIATFVVAVGLALFAAITASNYYTLLTFVDKKWMTLATRLIGSIFIVRTIGDFNICGIFKKKSESLFARRDTYFYIPLCMYLGITSILITVL